MTFLMTQTLCKQEYLFKQFTTFEHLRHHVIRTSGRVLPFGHFPDRIRPVDEHKDPLNLCKTPDGGWKRILTHFLLQTLLFLKK